jgi:hypothetical protein
MPAAEAAPIRKLRRVSAMYAPLSVFAGRRYAARIALIITIHWKYGTFHKSAQFIACLYGISFTSTKRRGFTFRSQ